MSTLTLSERQKDLEQMLNEALKDPNLLEALQAFQMGQYEYTRAITGLLNIKIFSSNTTNLREIPDANLARH